LDYTVALTNIYGQAPSKGQLEGGADIHRPVERGSFSEPRDVWGRAAIAQKY